MRSAHLIAAPAVVAPDREPFVERVQDAVAVTVAVKADNGTHSWCAGQERTAPDDTFVVLAPITYFGSTVWAFDVG